MTKRRWVGTGLLLGVLATPPVWAGGIAVIDVSAIAQAIAGYKTQVMQYAEQLEQTRQQLEQVRNQIVQIQHAATTVAHGAQNLTRLDFSNLEAILTLDRQLQHKIAQAEYIGYQVDNAVGQAQKLYPRIEGVLDADAQRVLQLQWADMKRDSAKVAIATQAIRDTQAQRQTQWQQLLTRAQAARGNLEIQQAAVQAQGVVGSQLMAIEQQLATQARRQSEDAMEQASKVEMEQAAMVHIMTPMDTTYTAAGRLLPASRRGRE